MDMFLNDQTGNSSEPTRTILGMKSWQAAALGGFLILDLLVVVIGLGLVLSSPAPVSAIPSPTVVAPTITDTPTPTLVPSETSATTDEPTPTLEPTEPAATLTLTPTQAVQAGWVDFTTDKLTLQLPESYAGGDPHTDPMAIINSLQEKGVTYPLTETERMIRAASPETAFWGIDSQAESDQSATNFLILYMTTNPDEHMADAVTRIIGGFLDSNQLLEQRQIINRNFEMQQVTMAPKVPTEPEGRLSIYIMKSNDILLAVVCGATVEEWTARQREFDDIAKSIRLILPDPTATAS